MLPRDNNVYTWNEVKALLKADIENGKEQLKAGFLAHELQQYIPEAVFGAKDAVNEDGSDNYQAIQPDVIIPYLVKAIQELKAEIDLLKAK